MFAAILGIVLLCFGIVVFTRSVHGLWSYRRSDEEVVMAVLSLAIMGIGICLLIPPIVTLGYLS